MVDCLVVLLGGELESTSWDYSEQAFSHLSTTILLCLVTLLPPRPLDGSVSAATLLASTAVSSTVDENVLFAIDAFRVRPLPLAAGLAGVWTIFIHIYHWTESREEKTEQGRQCVAANLPWAQKLAPDKPLPFFFCTRRGIEPAMLSAPRRRFKWRQFLL